MTTWHGRYILDAHGEPVLCDDVLEWGRWYEKPENRRVAEDRNEGSDGTEVCVSTVFLALDHQFSQGPPVLWETLVFGGVLDGEMNRYTSRVAALAGHQRMCERVNASLRKPLA